jgi:hypothetical protein
MSCEIGREQRQLVRILRTIDALANQSHLTTVEAINREVCKRTGSSYSTKTTNRDLRVLKTDLAKHFRGNGQLRIDRTGTERMLTKLLRVLRLIVMLADGMQPPTLQTINQRTSELTGTQWCLRTTRRDVGVLRAMGLVTETEQGFAIDRERCGRLRCVGQRIFEDARQSNEH